MRAPVLCLRERCHTACRRRFDQFCDAQKMTLEHADIRIVRALVAQQETRLLPATVGLADQILRRHADAIEKRSEEHTSELQYLMRNTYAVFCLKKKTTLNTENTTNITIYIIVVVKLL